MAGSSSAGQPSWKSANLNQQTLETKTFTWSLRSHIINPPRPSDPSTFKNTINTNQAGPSRLVKTGTNKPVHGTTSPEMQDQFLRFQEFEIEAGQSLGLHSMWSLFLVSCGNTPRSSTNLTSGLQSDSDFLGLFLHKILKPSQHSPTYLLPDFNDDQIYVRYKIEIMDREGEILYEKECETDAKDKLEIGYWDWKKIVPVAKFHCCGKSEVNDENCLLLLRVSFTIINRRKDNGKTRMPPVADKATDIDTSTKDAANAFLSLVTTSKSLQPDVVIEIPSRRKFLVHKKILIGRSPVFQKILGANTNEKSQTVVKMEDISANTTELILKHIYTGQLEVEWTSNPVTATELIYASEKYMLPALKEFCNKHLVLAATKTNCYKLMEVAQHHNLEQATDDLMAFVSEGISSNSNSRKPSEESVEMKT